MSALLNPVVNIGLTSNLKCFTSITSTSRSSPTYIAHRRAYRCVAVRASSADDDAELEKRLEKLRKVKGATPYGQGAKAEKTKQPEPQGKATASKQAKKEYDFSGESLYYEGPPHRGDLVTNLALGTTLVWLPLTLAAVGRAAFVKYRFTDRRLSVQTTAPWKQEQTDVAYQEVKDVVTVGRGIGLWGDMVVTLKDNSKVELRSLDRFKELKEYILKRRDELAGPETMQGGVLTQQQLLDGPIPATMSKKQDKKGFA